MLSVYKYYTIINSQSMWLKKIFNPHQKQQPIDKQKEENEIKKFEQQDEVMMSSVVIDVLPDTRYKQYKQVQHNSQIKFPLTAIHETQNIILHQINLFNAKVGEQGEWKQINIMVTDRQLVISPNIIQPYGRKASTYFSINFGSIEKSQVLISKKKQAMKLKIVLKDNRQIYLKCVLGDLISKVYEILNNFAFVKGVNKFYAYRYGGLNKSEEEEFKGWQIYNIKRQFMRQGLLTQDQGGLNLKYIDNQNGEISSTYPQLLVIPSKITDAELKKCAQFRTKQRFPSLTYILQYKINHYSTLFRCSQNKVGVLYARSKQDELMIQYIGDLTGQFLNLSKQQQQRTKKNCKIYDARGFYAALGNMIAGKGFEKPQFYTNCQIQWLNIPNIHAVRDSFNLMINYKQQSVNFYTLCAQTGWYDYLYLIIAGAKSIAKDLLSGLNVVVHCSDGWDRTSQLCALSQLIIDPYYRTIQGFAVLVEKDWRHFGHKFRSRTGQYHAVDYHPHQKSPIFIQFLDCVYQIMQQFPLSFQFNQRLLQFLAKFIDSNVYGTFMVNNVKQCKQLQLQQNTVSIWSHVLKNSSIYKNPFYQTDLGQFWLNVGTQPKNMTVWRSLFLGDGTASNTPYQIMKHETQMNNILKSRYYNNQVEIEQLTKKLQSLNQQK